jgi:type VI secretion system secreted protein Hcp
MADADYFLRIDRVEGESTSDKRKGSIDVLSWSWGASNPSVDPVGGGAGAGRVSVQDFNFSMYASKAGPRLFQACATGEHLREARFSAVRAGEQQQEFLTLTFSDVLVSSYQTGGSQGGGTPIENVSLGFARIAIEYRAVSADGKLQPPVTAGWDLRKNAKV